MTKLVLVLAALIGVNVATPPRCFCPVEYNPVCGTNGRNYFSPCILNCARRRGEDVYLQKKGECDQPICTCSGDYQPVCGSNGVTYGNDCLLNCATAGDSTLSIAQVGSCANTVIIAHQPECTCPNYFNPVCGKDGVTYNNDCLLECAGQQPAKRGPCEPPCTCPKLERPVCGSDGTTYANPCLLNCATKEDHTLKVAHFGPCEESSGILIVEQPGCVACRSDDYSPVCGSDTITYNNECLMRCAGVRKLKEGPCEPPCTCPYDDRPVCGSDNVTYGNDCLLNCATKDDSTLRVAYGGACGTLNLEDNPDCSCTREFEPACGADGVTYNNECLARCAGSSLDYVGRCRPSCACPRRGKAVCGSDGVTYRNICLLNCATKDDYSLRVAYPGACRYDFRQLF